MPCYQDPHQGYTPSEEVQKLRNQIDELNRQLEKKPRFISPGVSTREIEYHFSPQDMLEKITNLEQKLTNSELELNLVSAYLCAILNELEVTGNLLPTLLAAEKNGQCEGIRTWWTAHKSQDVQRLKTELNKHFSAHEIELLKKVINSESK